MRIGLLALCLLFPACASTPDPAEICTASWIEPRSERAMDRIEKRVDKSLDAFRSVGESWMSGQSPGPIQMYRLSRAVESLERELKSGPGARDLRTLARTCDDPEFIEAQVERLLARADVPNRLITLLDRTGILAQVIDWIERGDTPAASG